MEKGPCPPVALSLWNVPIFSNILLFSIIFLNWSLCSCAWWPWDFPKPFPTSQKNFLSWSITNLKDCHLPKTLVATAMETWDMPPSREGIQSKPLLDEFEIWDQAPNCCFTQTHKVKVNQQSDFFLNKGCSMTQTRLSILHWGGKVTYFTFYLRHWWELTSQSDMIS